jgi:dTDP-4-amino-4,6-dideoxygalactose transaminase
MVAPAAQCTIANVNSGSPHPVPMLDFSRQYQAIRQEVLDAITAVCDSQKFILGPAVTAFEASSASACATSFAIGCGSGTDALWLALASAGIGNSSSVNTSVSYASAPLKQDAVVTTPFSFFASASAILRAGACPIFADIDPRTFNLAPESVAEVLRGSESKNVKAILPVHLYGQCADMDAFAALRQNHPGLLLIEDAAQAFGATWNGKPAGSLGDAAAFSFYPTKNLSAAGEAGLLTTNSPAIAERAHSLRSHGMTRRYYHDEIGWNCRLDSIQAAVLSVKLRYLPEWNRKRQALAARYRHLFEASGLSSETVTSTADGVVLPYTDSRASHIFHQYVLRAPRRDELRQYLTERQIGSEIYYPVPLHLQAALKDLGSKSGDFPESERAANEVLALPLYPELRDDEQQTVVEAIRAFYA